MQRADYDTAHLATLDQSGLGSDGYGRDSKDLEPQVTVQLTPDQLAGPHTAVRR